MSSPGKTSLTLLMQVANSPDDERVWWRFVDVYGVPIIYWCRQYGLQDADARDLAQEVLVRFWRQARGFRYNQSKSFRSYLRLMIRAAWTDWYKRRAIGGVGEGSSQITDLIDEVPARDELVSRLEQAYDVELFQLAMDEVQQRVEPRTWEAFRLLAMEGRAGSEVARLLQMEVNTVYVARSKVQRMIRQTMEILEASADKTQAP